MQTVKTTVGRAIDIYDGIVLFENGNTKVPAKLSFKLAFLKESVGKTYKATTTAFKRVTDTHTTKNPEGRVVGYNNAAIEEELGKIKEEEVDLELPSFRYKEIYDKDVMLLPQKLISALYPFIEDDNDKKPGA